MRCRLFSNSIRSTRVLCIGLRRFVALGEVKVVLLLVVKFKLQIY